MNDNEKNSNNAIGGYIMYRVGKKESGDPQLVLRSND